MTNDAERLMALIEIWHDAATDAVALLRGLDARDWAQPTDLPGWDVRAVAAHMAHLESELAGNPQPPAEVPDGLPHVRGMMGQFTEAGPLARADWTTSQIVDELETSVSSRYAALLAEPPTEPDATAPGFAGLIGWSWQTLLSNRPLDLWMHEQDIRRAVGTPGNLDSAAAVHVAGVFAKSVPYVLGKKAKAEVGQSLLLDVTGAQTFSVTAQIGDDGRGALLGQPVPDPTTRVSVDFAAFVVRCGGRREAGELPVELGGDRELGARFFEGLATTP